MEVEDKNVEEFLEIYKKFDLAPVCLGKTTEEKKLRVCCWGEWSWLDRVQR